jgi:hypothetical protein
MKGKSPVEVIFLKALYGAVDGEKFYPTLLELMLEAALVIVSQSDLVSE